jgi:hypothetical protein
VMPPAPSAAASAVDEAKALDAAATWLVGSFSVVTAVLVGLGATGGSLERMLRNQPVQSKFAFLSLALAIGLAGIAKTFFLHDPQFPRLTRCGWTSSRRFLETLVGGSQQSLQRRLLILGGLAFALGIFLATDAAVASPSDQEKPSITASFELGETLTLTGSVKATSLPSAEEVHVIVNGLMTLGNDDVSFKRLYESRSGPNAAGTVELQLKVPISVGIFERVAIVATTGDAATAAENCTTRAEAQENDGCLVLSAPGVPERPQVAASWESSGETLLLSLEIAGEGLRDTQAISALVVGEPKSGPPFDLYRSFFAPSATGHLKNSFVVPVQERAESVCVAAISVDTEDLRTSLKRLFNVGPSCPPKATEHTSWIRLDVPSPPRSPDGAEPSPVSDPKW